MEEAVEWLSCMKWGGGAHAQADNDLKTHTRLSCSKEGDAQTNRRQKKKRKKKGGGVPAADGLLASSWNKLGHRRAPSLQGILGASRDTE